MRSTSFISDRNTRRGTSSFPGLVSSSWTTCTRALGGEKERGERGREEGGEGEQGGKGGGREQACRWTASTLVRGQQLGGGQSSSCEDSLQKPRSWAHTVMLRPEPSVDYRTLGLAVALLEVLSRVRRPLAQLWDSQHDVDFFLSLQRQSIQDGGLSASDSAHISKKKKRRPGGSLPASGFRPRSTKTWVRKKAWPTAGQ